MGRASRKKKRTEAEEPQEALPEPEPAQPQEILPEDAPPVRSPGWRAALLAGVVLAVVLAFLFRESFERDKVLFANDAPWGVVHHYITHGQGSWGSWLDTNWVGRAGPAAGPTFTTLFGMSCRWFGGWFGEEASLVFANFYAPASLWLLGMCAWLFFRQLGCSAAVCLLGGLAAALNGDFFSYACWGLPSVGLSAAMTFLALAAIVSMGPGRFWGLAVLAGLAVGQGVMEGYDVGALFSLYAAAIGFFWILNTGGLRAISWARGVGAVAVMTVFAGLMAYHSINSLKQTELEGVVVRELKPEDKWDLATQWSLPKAETFRVGIPGLFGYRKDTPEGGSYWGLVGQHPVVESQLEEQKAVIEKFADQDQVPPEQKALIRENAGALAMVQMQQIFGGNFPGWSHSGYGVYAGVLVLLVALWALASSFRFSGNAPFSAVERRLIWLCAALALGSLLLAWGRHAPFYTWIHGLPFFSDIRNPIKFMHPFSLLVVVLFGLGLKGISRLYLEGEATRVRLSINTLVDLVNPRSGFESRWLLASVILLLGAAAGWLTYTASEDSLASNLQPYSAMISGFRGGGNVQVMQQELQLVAQVSSDLLQHSFARVGWFVGLTFVSLVMLGIISMGQIGRQFGILAWMGLGLFLVIDLGLGSAPYLKHEDRAIKYGDNALFNYLRTQPKRGPGPDFPGSEQHQPEVPQLLDRVTLLDEVLNDPNLRRTQPRHLDQRVLNSAVSIRPPSTNGLDNMGMRVFMNYRGFLMSRTNTTVAIRRHLPGLVDDLTQRGLNDPVLLSRINDMFIFALVQRLQGPGGAIQRLSQEENQWRQHHFPRHGIPSLDIVQDPRRLIRDEAFKAAFRPAPLSGNATAAQEQDHVRGHVELLLRHWELTSTRYLLCVSGNSFPNLITRRNMESLGYREALNFELDPGLRRFRTVQTYDKQNVPVEGRPRARRAAMVIDHFGEIALAEFTGALPRARLFADWRQGLDDNATLQLLTAPGFDPQQQVVLAGEGLPEPMDPQRTQDLGQVELVHYAIKRIQLKTPPTTMPTVLLLNDRHTPDWKVYVDGEPKELLKANYLMRAVYLEPAEEGHEVEFRYEPPTQPLYISMGAGVFGLVIGFMGCCCRRKEDDTGVEEEPETAGADEETVEDEDDGGGESSG